jgi:hypothetical protein
VALQAAAAFSHLAGRLVSATWDRPSMLTPRHQRDAH